MISGFGPQAAELAGRVGDGYMHVAPAAELRGRGIHVALLIVDATIESPKTADRTAGAPRDSLGDMALIAQAVQFLSDQQPRAYTHELMVTPAGETWVP